MWWIRPGEGHSVSQTGEVLKLLHNVDELETCQTKGQAPGDPTSIRPRMVKFMTTEERAQVTTGWGRGDQAALLVGGSCCFWVTGGGGSCTAL